MRKTLNSLLVTMEALFLLTVITVLGLAWHFFKEAEVVLMDNPLYQMVAG